MLDQPQLPSSVFCVKTLTVADKRKKTRNVKYVIPTFRAFFSFLRNANIRNFSISQNNFSRLFMKKHKYNKMLFHPKRMSTLNFDYNCKQLIALSLLMSLNCLFGFHKSILRGVYGIG